MLSFNHRMPHTASVLRRSWALATLALCAFTFALAGCETTRVDQSLMGEYGGNEEGQRMEFWHNLAEKRLTSNDEALHGLLLFAKGSDYARSFNGRVMDMKAEGWLPKDFNGKANEAVTRGTVAYALVGILDIEGGITMRVFGPSERYATRELRYRGLFPQSSQNQTFSGGQFIGVIGRAEDYQRSLQNNASADASEGIETNTNASAVTAVAPAPQADSENAG